jgi:hypothetical protein
MTTMTTMATMTTMTTTTTMATERDGAFAPSRWSSLPALRPYARWLARFDDDERAGRWPAVATLRRVLDVDVDFVIAARRLPVGLDASDLDDSYVGRCVRGVVPTREGSLHDFMNALTWARFPQAKRALSQRHHDVALARGRTTNRLRTSAQDRLSMVDEGGVLAAPDGATIVLGHGLLEDEVRGRVSRGLRIDTPGFDDADVALVLRHLALDTPPITATHRA